MPIARSILTAIIGVVVALTLSTEVLHPQPAVEQTKGGRGHSPATLTPDTAHGRHVAADLASPAIQPLTPDERDMIAWARGRFALVGLDLPELDISFHEDTRFCGGHDGVYRHDQGRPRVRICVPDPGTFAFTLHRKRTLIHEFAHAWEQANFEDEDRRDLLAILDADDWYAPEAPWEQRGAERFAETLVWGLYDQIRRPTLIEVSCPQVHANFRAITGTTALGPLEARCELGAAQPAAHSTPCDPTSHETNRRSEPCEMPTSVQ